MRATLILVAVFAVALAGCGSTPQPHLVSPRRDFGDALRGGVARADITPPPGLALFGHGPEGRVAIGTLLRLRCQAFVLVRGHEASALVPCDLGAMSTELHRDVARRVLAAGVPLGAERIVLMATHTHAGPAHYFGPHMYSGPFASRTPGYDPNVLAFLSERIAGAIVRAYRGRVAVRVAWEQRAVYGLTRNRSFPAFVTNMRPSTARSERVPDILTSVFRGTTAPCAPIGGADCLAVDGRVARNLPPAERAVDPTLSTLRIDAVTGEPLGVFALFGIHNTAVANTNALYHGDVFGYATRALERTLQREIHRDVVVGIANGAEGDVSPTWEFQSPRESRRIGEALAAQLHAAYGRAADALSADAVLLRAYRELELPGRQAGNGHRVCRAPALGTAAVGGAEDGPTRLRFVPEFNEGSRVVALVPRGGSDLPARDDGDECQGPKLQLLPPLTSFDDSGLDFPSIVPISIVRIGNGLVAALPAELTTTVGTRLREHLDRALRETSWGNQVQIIGIAGLANSYLQYVTTAREYNLQHYEGASTIYGPSTASMLDTQAVCLARVLAGADPQDACRRDQSRAVDAVGPIPFEPEFEAERLGEEPTDVDVPANLTAPPVTLDGVDGELAWTTSWLGIPPAYTRLHERQIVEVVGDDEAVIDDDDGSSLAVQIAPDHGASRWTATWVPGFNVEDPLCNTWARVRVRGVVSVTSARFRILCSLAANPEPVEAP